MNHLRLSLTAACLALSLGATALADGVQNLTFSGQSKAFSPYTTPKGMVTDYAQLSCGNGAYSTYLGGGNTSRTDNGYTLLGLLQKGSNACKIQYSGVDSNGNSKAVQAATFNLVLDVVNNSPVVSVTNFATSQSSFTGFYYFVNGQPVEHTFSLSASNTAAGAGIALTDSSAK